MAQAQDLIPGAFTPAPIGFNVLNVSTLANQGGLAFDPALPIEEAQATIGAAAFGIGRTMNIAGRYANVAVAIPFLVGHVEGLVLDRFQSASRRGFGDLIGRVGVNLYGAPAMTPKEFAARRPSTIVGVAFSLAAPVGQYDPDRYVNLGANRWAFKPELGIMHPFGPWTLEGDLGVVFFTDNTDYVNDARREQEPIVNFQAHLIRNFRPGLWVAADANYWKGGRVTTGGRRDTFEQRNSRIGVTLAVPVRRHQFRFAYSFGAFTTIGGDFHSLGLSYSYAWAWPR